MDVDDPLHGRHLFGVESEDDPQLVVGLERVSDWARDQVVELVVLQHLEQAADARLQHELFANRAQAKGPQLPNR